MNRVIFIGNLTKDPELTTTASNTPMCRFTLAVNRPYVGDNGERQTDFFHCTAWKGTAQNIAKYCRKGNKLMIEGSIQLRPWEDNNGNKQTAVDITVQNAEFLTPNPNKEREPVPKRSAANVFDDDGDIPF